MKLLFTEDGWDDYQHWIRNDQNILDRINRVMEDTRRDPFKGIGKPEPLKGALSGWWSRRITGDHRLVYRLQGLDAERRIVIAQCRYHY